jgi:hypothetical protein
MMRTNTNRKTTNPVVDVLNSKAFKSIINIININSGDLVTSYFIKKIIKFRKVRRIAEADQTLKMKFKSWEVGSPQVNGLSLRVVVLFLYKNSISIASSWGFFKLFPPLVVSYLPSNLFLMLAEACFGQLYLLEK